MNANIQDPVWICLTSVGVSVLTTKCPEKFGYYIPDEDRVVQMKIVELLYYFGEYFKPDANYTELPFTEIIEFTEPKKITQRLDDHWTQ